ncbi:MAG TPA: hypothetical protein PKI20_03830 [Verrucomicrobiota bacterium]|mgnify:CR=1 FL=1|nr:hypothetical protein [Verrucomicrobiota bacterium]
MKIELLDEPELEFGRRGRHIDIRFGIKAHGPVSVDESDAPRDIKVGMVGTPASLEKLNSWMSACRNPISAKPSKKPNLFPSFPGFALDRCFYSDWSTSDKLQKALTPREIRDVLDGCPRNEAVQKTADMFIAACKYLTEYANPDVLVCAPPLELFQKFDIPVGLGDEDEGPESEVPDYKVDFHDYLKARGLKLAKPVQFVRPPTYDVDAKQVRSTGNPRSLQDPATRAWNFFTALYYKAKGIPWRLLRRPSEIDSAYIGISFYLSPDKEKTHTSVAQVFNERGEGMIVRGGEAKRSEEDRQVHLTADAIAKLVINVLAEYKRVHKNLPARVVVHKTSGFNDEEKQGCNDALKPMGVDCHDYLAIGDSLFRLYRHGEYPPLRGTFVQMDTDNWYLYTRGSIDFYMAYPGMYVPRSLEIIAAEADQAPRKLAEETLALTKMNWNNTQFDNGLPITIKAARQVGGILKYAGDLPEIEASYAYYM